MALSATKRFYASPKLVPCTVPLCKNSAVLSDADIERALCLSVVPGCYSWCFLSSFHSGGTGTGMKFKLISPFAGGPSHACPGPKTI